MSKLTVKFGAALVLLLVAAFADAQSLGGVALPWWDLNKVGYTASETHFRYVSSTSVPFKTMAWSPTGSVTSPGIHYKVHGEPAPEYVYPVCPVYFHEGDRASCNTKGCFRSGEGESSWLTGVAGPNTYFLPQCGEFSGHTHAVLGKGIGLLTYTGPSGFMQPKRYTNRPILSSYVSFSLSRWGLRPFSAPCSTECDSVYMRVRSTQQMALFLDAPQSRNVQKIAVVLENTEAGDAIGRIEYTPNTFCTGKCPFRSRVNVQVDHNQGGMSFVGGNMLGGAQEQYLPNGEVAWTSYGKTRQVPGVHRFAYKVTWGNLRSALKYTASRQGLTPLELYGEGWDDRMNWQVKKARYAQETSNPQWQTDTAYIGGKLRGFFINAEGGG